MCGIAGIFGKLEIETLRRLSRRLAHRGPDGDGVFVDFEAGIGLAHRRLAIIDPTTAAAQPMLSADGRYRVVFNGEIYNFKELAAGLGRYGYEVNARSDTAVIAPLYDRYGIDFLARLNGIFAIAIWDCRERELIVARDASGVKPLYYVEQAGGLLFASELKALAPELRDRSLDPSALIDYLTYLWSPGEGTLFRSVRKLLPGHMIRVSRWGFEIKRWHEEQPSFDPIAPLSYVVARETVASTFERAVARQCISDVPIGAFLSGGVDSSSIVAAMVATGNVPKRTYCVAFDTGSMAGEGFGDDVFYAREMADRIGVKLSVITVAQPTPDDMANLPYLLDEPTADPAALYVEAISRAARADGIKVLLGGTGGDDIFSGYRRHRAAALRPWLMPLRLMFSASLLTPFFSGNGAFARRIAKLGYMLSGSDEEFLVKAFEFNKRENALACLSAVLGQKAAAASDGVLHRVARGSAGIPLLERMLQLESYGFLPDHNLNYTDKASMAHGVEVRVPFLDRDLMSLARLLPTNMKMRWGQEKWIFKQAMATKLPKNIITRKKTGFGAPVRTWLTAGPLRTFIEDTLSSRSFIERGVFSPSRVRTVLDDTVAGRMDGAYLVLASVMVEHWLRSFGDNGEFSIRQAS